MTVLAAAGLFVGMLAALEVGRRRAASRLARDPDSAKDGGGPVEAAIFGLLGLLLAFTFSGAASRFEGRRHLITDEANAIGTAYLRIDLIPSDAQPAMRDLFRHYLDLRLETYRLAKDQPLAMEKYAESVRVQGEIWTAAVAASRREGIPPSAALLLLPALNQMIDITTTRLVAVQNHPPSIIYVLLAVLGLLSAVIVGDMMGRSNARRSFHALIFAATMAVTLYVILDLEYPRLGLIRIDSADQTLVDLRQSMR